ncbi:hypothetical protein DFR31_2679, partial [Alkalispirillum mobile]
RHSHLTVHGDRLAEVRGDAHLTVQGERRERTGGDQHLTVDGTLHQNLGTAQLIEAGREIHQVAGMNLVLEAGAEITLQAGGSFIKIDPAGITLSGAGIRMNSGGSPSAGSGQAAQTPALPEEAKKDEPAASQVRTKLDGPRIESVRQEAALRRERALTQPCTPADDDQGQT